MPIANRIVADLTPENPNGEGSKYASVLLVTIWEFGEAAGPLLIAPLSEIVGRWPVMNVAHTLFVLTTVLAAVSPSASLLIFARALSGLMVTSNVLNPAVIGDIFEADHRGSAMSYVQLSPLIGGAAGPAISGAIAETLSWRWVLWTAAILAGVGELLFLTCFRETYKPAILRRRLAKKQKGRLDGEHGSSGAAAARSEKARSGNLVESVTRPFIIFGSSGVLMSLSLFGSVAFTHFYTIATTLPDILEERYGLSPALTGSSLFVFTLGSVITVGICNQSLDRIYRKMKHNNSGVGHPEFRLPLVILGGFTLPPLVALYGWAAELHLPLPVLLLSVGLIGTALGLAVMPLPSYVVDAFGLYSASAMTGLIVSRCLMATFLPLVTTPLVEAFGYGWGFTVLGAFTLALAPIPIFLMRYGETWRERSQYTKRSGAQ